MEKMIAYSKNNIICHAPPVFWWQGWLIGNGSGGATIWNPEDKIEFQLGHTDLLDRTPDTSIDSRNIPNTRHNIKGNIRIHNIPLFDTYYIKDYTSQTRLDTGVLDMNGESEFGKFSLTSYYLDDPDVFALKYTDETTQKAVRSFSLEKMGSRFFSRIWTGSVSDTSFGKGITTIKHIDDIILFSHEKGDFKMATAVKIHSNLSFTEDMNDYSIEITFPKSNNFELTFFSTLGIADTIEECERIALAKISNATSFCALREIKEERYSNELPDTHITLPDDPYYENLWYVSRYHMRISYKGHYPAFFINGPFGGNRDKREWSDCWLHWNMHGSHQGIIKSGDNDLFKAYADYKMRQIPSAKDMAKTAFNCGGIVTQDQQKPDGGSRGIIDDYHTLQVFPSLQNTIHFHQYWKFTGDKEFFRDYLLPYFKLTMEFWKDYLVLEDDGQLHVPRSIPYEFHNGYAFKDSITEISLLKACFNISEELSKVDESDTIYDWCEYAKNTLADFVNLPILEENFTVKNEDGSRFYDNPFFYGDAYAKTDRVIALGVSERHNKHITHMDTYVEIDSFGNGGFGAFCSSYTAFMFPSNLVNSDASPKWRDKTNSSEFDNSLWENGRNALRTICRVPPKPEVYHYDVEFQDTINWSGHSLELPAFARMGLVKPLEKALKYYTEQFQMFPQGMFNYHPKARWTLDFQDTVSEDGRDRRLDFLPFVQHFSFEELGIYTETIDTMLLESSGGIIRTFVAYEKDASFKLPAENGFIVEALQKDKQVHFIKINSLLENSCKVRVDWEKCYLYDGEEYTMLDIKNSVVSFETKLKKDYILTFDKSVDTAFEFTKHNPQPHKNRGVTLGIPYRF